MGSQIISNAVPVVDSNNEQQIKRRKELTWELATISPDSDRAKEIQDELSNMSRINMIDKKGLPSKKFTDAITGNIKDSISQKGVGLIDSIAEASRVINDIPVSAKERDMYISEEAERILKESIGKSLSGISGLSREMGIDSPYLTWGDRVDYTPFKKADDYIPAEYSPNTGWDFKEDLNEKDDNK